MEIPGYCTLCRSRCGSLNEVRDGKLVAVKPLPGHPTGGALCAKGRAAPELVGSPRRLTMPLRRTRPRSDPDPGWQPISWDEALDEIAARLSAARAAHGAESVAFAVTTPSGTPMIDSFEWVERFVRCFGSPNLIYAVEVCGWHKDYAHALTFGRGIGAPDYERAETIVLWGHNPARTWLAQATRIAQARRRGARVVVVDPKPEGSGQQADLWLRIRPGADGALAMGAIRHLIETRGYDESFVRRWTNAPMLVDLDSGRLLRAHEVLPQGRPDQFVVVTEDGTPQACDTRRELAPDTVPRLRARLDLAGTDGRRRRCASAFELLANEAAAYTVEQVARLTWLEPDAIQSFNALFAGAPKLAYHAWTGVGQHTNATMTERAMATLYALTGACDRPGGNIWTVPAPVNSVGDYSLLPAAQQAKALGLAELPLGPPARGWITARAFRDAALHGRPYRVSSLLSFGANFVVSQGDSAQNLQALQALDFHVHVDMFMNPTAQNADIVLPANLPWEREALKAGFEITQEACELVQLRPRMLQAPGQARSDYDIVFDLALRLGMADQFFGGSIEAGWNYQLEPLGVTVQDLRARPEGLRFGQPFRHEKYAPEPGRDTAPGFATPSRRVEIYSESLARLGQPAVACFVEPVRLPAALGGDARYPLVLTTAKSGWFIHSSYRHVASLRRKSPDPAVEIGPGLAARKGIAAGDWTRVGTPGGSVLLRARINPALDDRVAIAEFGWWEDCPALGRAGRPASGAGSANINSVLGDAEHDPVSGSVPLRAGVCDIERAREENRGRWSGERSFEVAARRAEARDMVALELVPCDGGPLPDFLPGQHVTVAAPAAATSRAYSLTGPNLRPDRLSIGVKRIHSANGPGRLSGYLNNLRPGDKLRLTPPQGVFTPPLHGTRPVLCVASGIGLTPFVGYFEALARRAGDDRVPRVHLLAVCRNRASHPYAGRLRELIKRIPGASMTVHYTAPGKADRGPGDYDRLGRPDFARLDPALLRDRPLAYLCGPGPFLDSARNGLAALGLPAYDIFCETFATRLEVPAACEPQTVRVAGKRGEFVWRPESGTLLDAAQAAGIDLPSGCRVGQCESCAVRVISGTVAHLSPYDGPADLCLTCQAIPLSPLELGP